MPPEASYCKGYITSLVITTRLVLLGWAKRLYNDMEQEFNIVFDVYEEEELLNSLSKVTVGNKKIEKMLT